MRISLIDRLVSVLAYFTFGMFSIFWLIFANVTRKRISPYLMFNLYQAIFISVILAVISLIYGIALDLASVVPFLEKAAKIFDTFFNRTYIYYTFSISGLIITIFLFYLSFLSLIGKRPYVPVISDVVESNFGG